MVVIGYDPVPCRTNEGEELAVQVGILFGLLARNLSVQLETASGSAVGEENHLTLLPPAVLHHISSYLHHKLTASYCRVHMYVRWAG